MGKTLVISAGATQASTANTTQYWKPAGYMTVSSTNTDSNVLFRSGGTFTNLLVKVSANTVAATSNFTMRKNETTDGALTVAVGSSATGDFEDTTHSDTVTAADRWTLKTVPGAATNTYSISSISLIFDPTTDTVTRLGTDVGNLLATASTTWFEALHGSKETLTEANVKCRMRKAGTLKNMGVLIGSARATNTTCRSRKNGANGTLVVTCTGATTGWFEDTTHSDTISAGEDWNYSITTGTGVDNLRVRAICGDFVTTTGHGLVIAAEEVPFTVTDNTNRFAHVGGNLTAFTTETGATGCETKARVAWTCSELTILVTQNDVGSNSTLDFRVGAAASALTVPITANTAAVFSDSTHTKVLVTTDKIDYNITVPSVSGAHTITVANVLFYTLAGQNITVTMDTETVTVGESLTRLLAATRAPATETTTIGESMARQGVFNRPLSTETTTIGETLARIKGLNRALATETTTIGESMAVRQTLNRAFPETTVIGESLARQLAANRTLSDTVVIGESLTRIKGLVRALGTETVTVGESLSRLLAANRALATENTTVGESLTRLLAANRSLSTETVVIGESLTRLLAANRVLSTETVTVGENLTRQLAANRSLATETVVVGESLTRLLAAIRALATQTTVISDQLDYVKTPGGGGTNYERALSDTVVIGESLTRMFVGARALATEVTAISENLARSRGVNRALATETVTIGESLTRLLAAIRALPETTSIGENLNRLLAATRTLNDTVVVGESLTKLRTVVRILVTETVSIGESLTRRFTGTRPLSDTTVISDSLTYLKTLFTIPTQLKSVVQWLRSKYSISTPPKDPSY